MLREFKVMLRSLKLSYQLSVYPLYTLYQGKPVSLITVFEPVQKVQHR